MKHLKSFQIFEQRKKTFPIEDSNVLKPLDNYNKQILKTTNETIVKKLQETTTKDGDKLELPEGYANPTDKNFLSRVSAWLETKGITPYLSINTDDVGRDESVSVGVSYNIPKTDISIDLQNGYFGVNVPLPKGINLNLGYQPGSKEDIVGGYKDKVGGNLGLNTKFKVGVTIPIGK